MAAPLLLMLAASAVASAPAAPPPAVGARIADFSLADADSQPRRLSDWQASKLVVVIFLSPECVLAKAYALRLRELSKQFEPRGVAVIGIDASASASAAKLGEFARVNELPIALLLDPDQAVAERFDARRTPEAFVLDAERIVRYRGRIDDQYEPGLRRPTASRADLASALNELLDGKPVSVPVTESTGCFITRKKPGAAGGNVTYTKHIAPILQDHCISCHRPGGLGPFALTSHAAASVWADTIGAVVSDGRMPPWHADPKYGKFANAWPLPERDKELILRWVADGAPEGAPADLPPRNGPAESRWRIRTPDLVIPMPETFAVPAAGTVPYQYYEIDPGFTVDTWIQEAEIRPGNRAVVHHCTVFMRPPGSDRLIIQGDLGNIWLIDFSGITPPVVYPTGMAKKVPAGWRLVFQMHYQTTGTPQTDRTELGLVLADRRTVQREVATNMALAPEMVLPPGAADRQVEASWHLPHAMLLLSMHPHMHLRGKSFRFEARYPDGTSKILLHVPKFNIHWETTYILAEPEPLPAGTTIHCTAHFDNSTANPANPDPQAEVRWGAQLWEEMMIGYFDVVRVDQDLTRPEELGLGGKHFVLGAAGFVVLGSVVLLRLERRRLARRGQPAFEPVSV
jgi:peroxiredoxin